MIFQRYELVVPPDGEWGDYRDGKWTGLVGLVHRQEVDMALGLAPSYERSAVVDWTVAYDFWYNGLAVRRDQAQVLRCLDPNVQLRKVLGGHYAFLGEGATVEHWAAEHCDVIALPDRITGLESYNIFTPKFSTLAAKMNHILLRLQDTGVLSYLHNRCDTVYTRLILNGNLLTQIPSDAFAGLHVSQIQVRQNPQLTLVRSGAFRSLPDLQDLILDKNGIVTIETEAFADLPQLRRLWLSGNSIKSLDNTTFVNLPSLVDLSLDKNAITRIENEAVVNSSNVQRFDVSNNSLTSLDHRVICGWEGLHILNLSHNPLMCDCSLSWVQVWRQGHVIGSNVRREVVGTCRDGDSGGEAGLYVHVFRDCQVIAHFGVCDGDTDSAVIQPVG
nr:hypothetical protein BaRGS_021369 [Batillaria attramentaria]